MIRAVVFDIDGTLVDTRGLHYEALNAALVACGCPPVPPHAHETRFDGLPTARKLDLLASEGAVPRCLVPAVAARKRDETRRMLGERLAFDPALYCLMCGLRSKGLVLGVASNAVRETVVAVLCRTFGLAAADDLFDAVAGNEDGEPKPAPDLYDVAAGQLGLYPRECLAVEDGEYGVRAATAAGCRVLRVAGPADVTPAAVFAAVGAFS